MRGIPTVIESPDLDYKKVVFFDGLSQMFSSYDLEGCSMNIQLLGWLAILAVKMMLCLHLWGQIGFLDSVPVNRVTGN